MRSVEVISNWSYLDGLDGKPLEAGEAIRVAWPDGSTTEETVRIDRMVSRASDMGAPYELVTTHAIVVVSVRGASARLRLYKSGALIERIVSEI